MHDLTRTNILRQDIAGPNGAAGELVGIGEGDDDEDNMHIAGGDYGPGTFSDEYLSSLTFAPRANVERTEPNLGFTPPLPSPMVIERRTAGHPAQPILKRRFFTCVFCGT